MSDKRELSTCCCIAGGGPAGVLLGYLLARAGLDVVVLEKHADFLRDFRGDTLHPSTLEVMAELGLLDALLKLPHQELGKLQAVSGDVTYTIANFTRLPTRCKFMAFLPQWEFLTFLSGAASVFPGFSLRMRNEVTDLLVEGEQVTGVRVKDPEGDLVVRADLVIGCDGRNSVVRERAELPIKSLGAPIDVLWFRVPRQAGDPEQATGRIQAGRLMVMINHGAHWQCGYLIHKGSADVVRERGLRAFRSDVAQVAPLLADRLDAITSWEDVPMLAVRVDRLVKWYRPGLLCIGDAAHAMSPVGGVGINVAIQDAVAAANLLVKPLREGRLAVGDLHRVQRRRQRAAKITQRVQIMLQNRALRPMLGREANRRAPAILRLVNRFPRLQRVPGAFVGLGVRPEHVAVVEISDVEEAADGPLAS